MIRQALADPARTEPTGRPGGPALAAVTLALACLAAVAAGCGSGGDTTGAGVQDGSMTEAQYVAHVAALTVAVGEGLTGEAAMDRAVQLGSDGYDRDEVERFAERLKEDPERWLEIEREIDERVAVMTRPEQQSPQGDSVPRS